MTESYFPAISTFETRAAEEHAIGGVWLGADEPDTEDTVRLRIAPAGVSVRGRFWREGRYLKAMVHVQTAGAAPKTISVDVDLRPIARALHHWYRRKHGVQVGGFPGSFFKQVKKLGKSKLISAVGNAVKSVVKSKIVAAAITATAVVFPPVGVPAAAAYATANAALTLLDKANAIKSKAKTVLASGSQAEKALMQAKAPEIAKALSRAANVRTRLQKIAQRAQQGDLAARKTASIFSHVMAHRDRVQSLGKNAAQAWTPGLLVTPNGKIVPGKWLHSQSVAVAKGVPAAPVRAALASPKRARRS
ncbi:MAG TPA: hypothetical protein VJV79_02400 [Polyangiaceae bacterium]|nr:hypothetical protein [Polyangiaceae bacterium]